MSTLVPPARRTWRIPRLPLEDWTFITFWGWVGLLALMVAIAVGMDRWNEITGFFGWETGDVSVTSSVWGPLAGLVVWYGGFVAGYYLHAYLPAFVAAGRTRRDSAIESGIFAGLLALLMAVLITIGFVVERVIFAIGGWSRGAPEDQLYHSYNDYGWMLTSLILGLVVWTTGGAMIGAGFYRDSGRGFVAIVIAGLMVTMTGSSHGSVAPFGFVMEHLSLQPSRLMTIVLSLVASAVMATVTWWTVRDVPVRNK